MDLNTGNLTQSYCDDLTTPSKADGQFGLYLKVRKDGARFYLWKRPGSRLPEKTLGNAKPGGRNYITLAEARQRAWDRCMQLRMFASAAEPSYSEPAAVEPASGGSEPRHHPLWTRTSNALPSKRAIAAAEKARSYSNDPADRRQMMERLLNVGVNDMREIVVVPGPGAPTIADSEAYVHENYGRKEAAPETFGALVPVAFDPANSRYKHDRSRRGMVAALERHARDLLDMPLPAITREHVTGVLRPLRIAGKRGAEANLMAAMARVFNRAILRGTIDASPLWKPKILEEGLPPRRAEVRNRVAVPLDTAPGVYKAIPAGRCARDRDAADACRFQALTAVRPIEAAEAEASEFDLKRGVWTIPKHRMKAKEAHTVPLSRQALAIVEKRIKAGGAVFPTLHPLRTSTRPQLEALRKVAAPVAGADGKSRAVDGHGWRATFSGWATSKGGYRLEVIDRALAHKLDKVTAAYLQGARPAKLVECLQAWADYLTGET